MTISVTLVTGEYSGDATANAITTACKAAGVNIYWDRFEISNGEISPALIANAKQTGVVLMAPSKSGVSEYPPSVQLRKALGMYAQVRNVKSIKGINGRFAGVDLKIVREISEDLYTGIEHESAPGVYESIKLTTKAACERIARFAFEEARSNRRKKLTIVHKSNIMKLSDGLLLRTATDIAKGYPEIETEEVIVDALCMKLVRDPSQFEVLLCGNLFGDIVSDLAAGLAGGPALGGAENHGDKAIVFENSHIPSSENGCILPMLIQTAELLKHLGEDEAAEKIYGAIERTLDGGTIATDSLFIDKVLDGI
jgi:isocitrate dehydrogenase (NAD+)